MIISHKHKFIFIKTKKTAGTSIEIALSTICGPDDIITPIIAEDESLRQNLGCGGPQNFMHNNNELYYYHHIGAVEIREKIGDVIWDQYYKFCFERNPWDKVISWYYWELQFAPDMPLDDFIRSGRFAEVGGPGGFDLYTDNGNVIVDTICFYESLEAEWSQLAERSGIKKLPELPRAKSKFRKDRRPYQAILSASQRKAIETAFQREIKLFGYEF